MKRRRCAIYTRKSTQEGLDQTFNSLDAQREACEAYITSQAGVGWVKVKDPYDDGGFSGGTMQRPGLQALMRDIEAGKVQIIVTYKVDRLTRSLSDFARMIELFDRHSVSFVSVTQQFNTTTSMGRLTLNVLLSFAQFEREVTAERIRDKIAASKRRGLWMGGVVPLGYDAVDKKLILNPEEAATVRSLYRLYQELGNVAAVEQEAIRLGLRTKARTPNNAKRKGGEPFTRGHIYKILSNPLYIGEVTHKGSRYPGEHQPIVDRDVWQAVQSQLKENAVKRHVPANSKSASLLKGLLYDGEGRPMKPAHANKKGRRYRYYITRPNGKVSSEQSVAWRLPAAILEETILQGLVDFLGDARRLTRALGTTDAPVERQQRLQAKAEDLKNRLQETEYTERQSLFVRLVERIDLGQGRIRVALSQAGIGTALLDDAAAGEIRSAASRTFDIPVSMKKRGVEVKLILSGVRSPDPRPDPVLIALVRRADEWMTALQSGQATSLRDLANQKGVDRGDVSKALPLAYLAPDITQAILEGLQPVDLTAFRLKRIGALPVTYLRDVLQRMVDGHKMNRLDDLLPWNWKPAATDH